MKNIIKIMSKKNKFRSEFIIQRITSKNLNIFDLKHITNEFQYHGQRIDTLAFDDKNKSFVIIEYKNEYDSNVINQTKRYYDLLSNYPQAYINRHNEEYSSDLKEEELGQTKVLIIGTDFKDHQIDAAKSPNFPFEIWKISKDENFCISYENLVSHEIKQFKSSEDELKLTEDELLYGRSEEIIELYKTIKNKVLNEFEDVTNKILIKGFSVRHKNKMICKFLFNENSMNAHFYTNKLKDPNNRLEDISDSKTEGKSKLILASTDDVDYFLEIFKQVIK